MSNAEETEKPRPSFRGPLLFVAILIGLLVFYWTGERDPRVDIFQFSGPTMGTKFKVLVVYETNQASVDFLQKKIGERLSEINARMSTYLPASEISQFNQTESTDWLKVSNETAEVVNYAITIAGKSNGAYDPTVGPLVNLWGFGPTKRTDKVPSDEAIDAAIENVGYQQIEVRLSPPALRKQNSAVYLDLSSVAKGHAADAIGSLLEGYGYQSYMVEIGGEVRTRGTKPKGLPWRVGLENPDTSKRSASKILELSQGESIATSGDYRNFFEVDGVKYSHTIDPKTGQPVKHDLATVTVAADLCRDADALATALLVLGPEEGYNWAVEEELAAYFVSRTTSGPKVTSTPKWNEQFSTKSEE